MRMFDESNATHYAIPTHVHEADHPPSDEPPFYLIVLDGGIPGSMLRIGPNGVRLGRAHDNTHSLPEASISRYHALVELGRDGTPRVVDLGSTNGTFLNGRRIADDTPTRIKDGDRIRLGNQAVLKFVVLEPIEERFQRDLFERAVRDGLTQLHNRSYFITQSRTLASHSARRGLGFALLLLDIDYFKRINDTLGHDGGDEVLRQVAQTLREHTRSDDLVARYGGEEFVIALPVHAPDLATERAERIRQAIADREIFVGHNHVDVTASVGVAYSPSDRPRDIDALVSAADRCLYTAKNLGRNCVVFRNDTGPAVELVVETKSVDL